MIHYQLLCGAAHEFDGWFKDSTTYEKQAKRGFIACPECGDKKVTRALMAPSLGKSRGRVIEHEPAPAPAPAAAPEANVPAPVAGGAMPDHVRAMLNRVRAEIEKNCDYVGPKFAQEARKIHNGDAPARGIYGESTDEEAEALEEDGIGVARIPWLPRSQ